MLSKAQKKLIQSLTLKKFRDQTGLFVAEGEKLVHELIHSSFDLVHFFATSEYTALSRHSPKPTYITDVEMKQISQLKTPSSALALVRIPVRDFHPNQVKNELILALDNIQDPGNLGTIIRLADWFGVRTILCSPHTVDAYNFKTVMSTMGSITRVHIHYLPLQEPLEKFIEMGLPIYGTFLEGTVIYQASLSFNGVIVMGNEGKGISPKLQRQISQKLYIPPYPAGATNSESLNVATATGIVLNEFRRLSYSS